MFHPQCPIRGAEGRGRNFNSDHIPLLNWCQNDRKRKKEIIGTHPPQLSCNIQILNLVLERVGLQGEPRATPVGRCFPLHSPPRPSRLHCEGETEMDNDICLSAQRGPGCTVRAALSGQRHCQKAPSGPSLPRMHGRYRTFHPDLGPFYFLEVT